MKSSSAIIFGAVLLCGTHLLSPLTASAQGQLDRSAFGCPASSLSLNRFSLLHLDDFTPPDTGGPGRSGGSGTR